MNDIAIRVQHLSKQYGIGKAQQRHDTLRDSVVAGLQGAGQRLSSIVHHPSTGDDRRRTTDSTIWALKDVSFEVKRGEVVGIPSAWLRAGTSASLSAGTSAWLRAGTSASLSAGIGRNGGGQTTVTWTGSVQG